jgi:hypothetical protein
LYYFNEKRLAVVFLIIGHCFLLFSQERNMGIDTLIVKGDSALTDTLIQKRIISPEAIDKTITYSAKGYRKSNLNEKKVYLVEDGVVTYGDITLKADSIVLNMENNSVYAIGRKDSTGKVIGSPVFQQGDETFNSKELTYNFKSGKARVINMSTSQDEGYLRSGVTKKLTDGSFNIGKSTYSTCDAEHPHFYVGFNKAKVIPGKKLITGPAYMVIQDIPLPIIIPFGFFPIQRKTAESGLIIPKLGQTFELGYSLRDGGYYFAINDNFDLALTGNIYTNGTWLANLSSSYLKRYRYSGKVSLSYANNVSGHKGLPDYAVSKNYSINWTYNQDAKAHPGSRFSANVNMSSSEYNQQNSYVPAEHVTAQTSSSVSYSKTWEGTPFNFSTSLNHSQNIRNKTVALNLPKANFSMQRIYPLKNRKMAGPQKWWQELQFQYTATMDNQINTYDSLMFTSAIFDNMKNGFRHEAPVSMAIRPFRNLPSLNISPQLMYSGVLYSQKYEEVWLPDYFDPNLNKTVPSVIKDTIRGVFYGQAVTASVSASLSPQMFMTYDFINPNSRFQSVRHVIKPSIGFSYVPELEGLSSDMWRTVQVDTAGNMKEYSIYDGNIYGTPTSSSKSGAVTFSLVNIVEAKVFQKNDTTGKPKKIKLIDNFTMNTSFNIFADSLNWAPLSMNYRTVLFNNLNIAANMIFSFYGYDTQGRVINESYFSQSNKPLRLTDLNASVDLDVSQLLKKNKKAAGVQVPGALQDAAADAANSRIPPQNNPLAVPKPDRYGYPEFNVPWTMRVAYSFYYSKPSVTSTINQSISLAGTLSLTRKTNITYTSGFDIQQKQITMTSIGIQRDLHCWIMSMDWVPLGYLKSWQFTIRIKASVLSDLKYERRKDFHDQY